MRPKLLIVLFAAAAFFCAFFGLTGVARAASADEAVSFDGTSVSSASSTVVRKANLAPPGSYAAKFGAPLCDDRAASAYAAEPRPAPVDSGEVAATRGAHGAGTAEAACQSSVGALFKATSDASPTQSDDLNREPPVARDLAMLPPSIHVVGAVELVTLFEREAVGGAREGYEPRDNPPPRPIPWRS